MLVIATSKSTVGREVRTEEGKGIDSSIQAESRSGMEGMESEDWGRLVRECVEGAIVLRDACRDGSKNEGEGNTGLGR